MRYCEERMLDFLQIRPTTVQNMVTSYVLTVECSVEIDYRFFEELTIDKDNPKIPGTYYASFKPGLGIITRKMSKTNDWKHS